MEIYLPPPLHPSEPYTLTVNGRLEREMRTERKHKHRHMEMSVCALYETETALRREQERTAELQQDKGELQQQLQRLGDSEAQSKAFAHQVRWMTCVC